MISRLGKSVVLTMPPLAKWIVGISRELWLLNHVSNGMAKCNLEISQVHCTLITEMYGCMYIVMYACTKIYEWKENLANSHLQKEERNEAWDTWPKCLCKSEVGPN